MFSYGAGYIGQGASYNFISAYFVLFLTDSVGIPSTLAGTISSIALCVEVVMGMMMGNMSDHCTSRMGRRRPFILFSAICIMPVMVMMMCTLETTGPMLVAYYLFFAILFRIVFCSFEIPNAALGAEITTDYDERTKQRTISRFMSIFGNGVGYIMPLVVLQHFAANEKTGWIFAALIVGSVTAGSWFFSFFRTKGMGMVLQPGASERKGIRWAEILKSYMELLQLKATRILVIYKGAFTIAFALYNVTTLYYLQYSVGIGNKYSSYMYAFSICIFFIMVPIVNKMALVMGKARQQMFTMGTVGIISLAVYFTGPSTIVGAIVYIGAFSIMQTSFWQVSYGIFYDVNEVDEYVNHKRREGDLSSLVSVLGTLISAVMVQLFGIVLDATGYNPDAAVQADSVVAFLNAGYILVPGICFIIGAVALKIFPINKKTFGSLQAALKLRREGEDYSQYMDDIQKIVGK